MELGLQYGESRGYWKYHAPGKLFRQAKAIGKVNNERATLPFDSGAEVSIVDPTFARKFGFGTLSGQDAILGMDFMVPAGIRLDLAEGTQCLPDEVRIQLSGRWPLYNGKVIPITVDRSLAILVGRSEEIPIRSVINVTVEVPSPVETEYKLEAGELIRGLPPDDSSPIEVVVQDQTDTTPAETPIEPEPSEIEPPEPPQGEPQWLRQSLLLPVSSMFRGCSTVVIRFGRIRGTELDRMRGRATTRRWTRWTRRSMS
ncbi:unnamed protein product [Phytophthora fragariaefolia]|uniref:Unnamed protein product n=1 Tax=Phytophthora fragariaefolia TaxID=1490495 RepID=A0A9W6XID1_9STRA|nr:unnamed protein product [Phytophthora fragariaefolia]